MFWTGLLTGLLIGASNGHILRLLILDKNDESYQTRRFVAWAAIIIS